jgi:hypothetical protein
LLTLRATVCVIVTPKLFGTSRIVEHAQLGLEYIFIFILRLLTPNNTTHNTLNWHNQAQKQV